jgi:hypothetical protein
MKMFLQNKRKKESEMFTSKYNADSSKYIMGSDLNESQFTNNKNRAQSSYGKRRKFSNSLDY